MAGIFGTYDSEIGPPHTPIDEYADRCNDQYGRILSGDP